MPANPSKAPARKSEAKSHEKANLPWQVVVLDDPVNLMEYVSRVLMRIFGFSRDKAEELMMAVHQRGKAVVWAGGRERGEMYVNQLHGAQLHAKLEKSE
ncbi:MAG: ATP-dependent Clp protease adapter ClpS [Akkermansiaceae bacterium]|jgi:ATP-dependent Clp protease adaptor protein ClpS